ncbi:MAG: hypothetical protein ACON32_15490, partial [Pirellulaceae bacterium]
STLNQEIFAYFRLQDSQSESTFQQNRDASEFIFVAVARWVSLNKSRLGGLESRNEFMPRLRPARGEIQIAFSIR